MSDDDFQIRVANSCARMAATAGMWLGMSLAATAAAFVLAFAINEPSVLIPAVVGILATAWNFTATFSYLKQHRAALAKLGGASP